MAPRNDCYVDTSAFIALLASSDNHHRFFRRLFAQAPPLVTSSLTIAEGHSWFLRKYNAERAARFLAFVRELPGLTIESFGEAEIFGRHRTRDEVQGSEPDARRFSWIGNHETARRGAMLVDGQALGANRSATGDSGSSYKATLRTSPALPSSQ